MRPLFEATRGIHLQDQVSPKNQFRYVMTPGDASLGAGIDSRTVRKLAEFMVQRKIIDAKTREYYLVDYSFTGTTLANVEAAIRSVHPGAVVHFLTHQTNTLSGMDSHALRPIRKGISETEDMDRPTQKGGTKLGNGTPEARREYLSFLYTLQNFLEARRGRRP